MKIWELVYKIKREYLKKYNTIEYNYPNEVCLLHWINKLGNKEYIDIFNFLNIKQLGTKLLFKYKDFEELFYYNKNLKYRDFWNLYDGIYRECRGLVLDIEKEDIVCLPFPKFFNIEEQDETKECVIRKKLEKAKTIEFTNKLDGSLIITRYYDNKNIICTSGLLDIDKSYILRYSTRFFDNNGNYQRFLQDYSDYTCLFECITSNNQLVVNYGKEDYGLYLIGMRNINTLEIKSYSEVLEIAKKYELRIPEQYSMSFDDILNTRNNYRYNEKEGYVMYLDGMLVKIKCFEYLLMHKRNKNSISKNDILKAICNETIDDLYSSCEKGFEQIIDETSCIIKEYCHLMEVKTEKMFKDAPKDKIEFFKYIKTQPKIFQKYLIMKYNNQKYSYLILSGNNGSIKYIKFIELEERLKELKKEME